MLHRPPARDLLPRPRLAMMVPLQRADVSNALVSLGLRPLHPRTPLVSHRAEPPLSLAHRRVPSGRRARLLGRRAAITRRLAVRCSDWSRLSVPRGHRAKISFRRRGGPVEQVMAFTALRIHRIRWAAGGSPGIDGLVWRPWHPGDSGSAVLILNSNNRATFNHPAFTCCPHSLIIAYTTQFQS